MGFHFIENDLSNQTDTPHGDCPVTPPESAARRPECRKSPGEVWARAALDCMTPFIVERRQKLQFGTNSFIAICRNSQERAADHASFRTEFQGLKQCQESIFTFQFCRKEMPL